MREKQKTLTMAIAFVRIGAIRYYLSLMVVMHAVISYQLVDSISRRNMAFSQGFNPLTFTQETFIAHLLEKTAHIDFYILGYLNALSFFWHFTFCAGLLLILLWCYRHAFHSLTMRNICAIASWLVLLELLLGYPENVSMFILETDFIAHHTYNASAALVYKTLYGFRVSLSIVCGLLILVGFTRWTLNTNER